MTCGLRCKGGASPVADGNTHVGGRDEVFPGTQTSAAVAGTSQLGLAVAPSFRFVSGWVMSHVENARARRGGERRRARAICRTQTEAGIRAWCHRGPLGSQHLSSSGLTGV